MRLFVCLLLMLLGPSALAKPAPTWQAALSAEIEELEAEQKALQGALKEAKASATTARGALEKDIERLTAALSKARADNASRSQQLPDAARLQSLESQTLRMEQATDRIRAWAKTRGLELEEGLVPMIETALAHVQKRGSLHRERAEYFGEDGIAREADILHIAEVAALVEEGSLALVLARDGSLRAAQLKERGAKITPSGRVVQAVLFDPTDSSPPPNHHQTSWLDWMHSGGPIMWPIALLGLIGVLLSLERALRLLRMQMALRGLANLVHHDPKGLAQLREPVFASVKFAATMAGPAVDVENEAVEALVSAKPNLRRGISFLGIVAAVSPLIGLLGTVTGMISTFAVITEHGTGDPRLLSGGISQALLTTQLGLTVAVPALLLHTGLLRWGDLLLSRIESLALIALKKRSTHA